MPAYPTGAPGQYYVDDSQRAGAAYDPPQFDPYNTHRPQDSYDQQQGAEYREPYMDEPSYPLPQAQPMEPLAKEEVSVYADEGNPFPRQQRCVHG